jgi:hypothetical protein
LHVSAAHLRERLAIVSHDPKRALRALRTRLCRVPYQIGMTSLWPGSFLAYVPDRYSSNARAAARQSGISPAGRIAGFVRHNRTNNAGDLARFYLFNLIFEQIVKEAIPGDLAELGVYKGNTAVLLAEFARAKGRRAYLFDTFEGFSPRDLGGIDAHKKVEFRDTTLASVQSLVGSESVEYVVGHFPESAATAAAGSTFCLVHLDCDLYLPMKAGLEYFYRRLAPGGFLMVHDYSSLNWGGAERAVDEFLADKPERLVPIPDKSGTAVIRKLSGCAGSS